MELHSCNVVAPPVAGPIVFPAGPLPRDVWSLVWGHLPIQGRLAASHTCRGWRADILENSRLWSQLDLHAYDANDKPGATPPTSRTAETRSNMRLIEHLLPRSKAQPLTLDVQVRTFITDERFQTDLIEFLELLSPRLAVLHMETEDPVLPGEILCDYGWSFPELRVLTLSPSGVLLDRIWEADFHGGDMPNLRHFALHGNFRLCSYDSGWVNLDSLHCTVNTILEIRPILLSAGKLQQLECKCLPSPVSLGFSTQLTWPDTSILTALSRVPDVHVAEVLGPTSVEWVFNFFVTPPRRRLLVEFVVEEEALPLQLHACAQLASATRLTMRSGGSLIFIEPDDGSGCFFQIVLTGLTSRGSRPLLDWELVPPLDSLTSLRVDATLWPTVMHRFPQAPLLADVVLVMRHTDEIGALLCSGLVAQVPPGAKLTLTSEPIAVTEGQVADLAKALGVGGLSMTGNVFQQ